MDKSILNITFLILISLTMFCLLIGLWFLLKWFSDKRDSRLKTYKVYYYWEGDNTTQGITIIHMKSELEVTRYFMKHKPHKRIKKIERLKDEKNNTRRINT